MNPGQRRDPEVETIVSEPSPGDERQSEEPAGDDVPAFEEPDADEGAGDGVVPSR